MAGAESSGAGARATAAVELCMTLAGTPSESAAAVGPCGASAGPLAPALQSAGVGDAVLCWHGTALLPGAQTCEALHDGILSHVLRQSLTSAVQREALSCPRRVHCLPCGGALRPADSGCTGVAPATGAAGLQTQMTALPANSKCHVTLLDLRLQARAHKQHAARLLAANSTSPASLP